MRLATIGLALAWMLLGACGEPEDGTRAPDPSTLLEAPPGSAGLQLGMRAELEPGQEATYCRYFVLPEGETFDVGRFEHQYTLGSHHFLVYRTDLTADELTQTEEFECDAAQLSYPVSYAAQAPEGELPFPAGVALRYQPGEVLMAQTHYLNATTERIQAEVRLNLWFAEGPVTTEAGTLFFYDWGIVLPPNSESSAEMHCEIPSDITLLFAMSHMHRRGIGYESSITGGTLAEPSPLYETTAWEDVVPSVYEPGVQVHAGQAIDFRCQYRNDTDQTIIEGPSAATNEMCMFVATYYPRLDPRVETCTSPGSGPVHHGTKTCDQTVACMQGSQDLVSLEECIVDTCEASSEALADFGLCSFYSCGPDCSLPGADCMDCFAANCLDQYLVCADTGC